MNDIKSASVNSTFLSLAILQPAFGKKQKPAFGKILQPFSRAMAGNDVIDILTRKVVENTPLRYGPGCNFVWILSVVYSS